jgi:hypothetical protein
MKPPLISRILLFHQYCLVDFVQHSMHARGLLCSYTFLQHLTGPAKTVDRFQHGELVDRQGLLGIAAHSAAVILLDTLPRSGQECVECNGADAERRCARRHSELCTSFGAPLVLLRGRQKFLFSVRS